MSSHRKKKGKLDDGGCDPELAKSVAAKLVKQLKAKKTIYFHYRGRVVSSRRVPDHSAQLKALDQIFRFLDLCPRPGESPRTTREDQIIEIHIRK
jgi:hypothetical protein